jgi:hypothetical protein
MRGRAWKERAKGEGMLLKEKISIGNRSEIGILKDNVVFDEFDVFWALLNEIAALHLLIRLLSVNSHQ